MQAKPPSPSQENNPKETEPSKLLATEIEKLDCTSAPTKRARSAVIAVLVILAILEYVLLPSFAMDQVQGTSLGVAFWPIFLAYIVIYIGGIVLAVQAPAIWSHRNLKRMPKRIESQALDLSKQGKDMMGLLMVEDRPGLGKVLHVSTLGAWVLRQDTMDQVFCRELLSFELQSRHLSALLEPLARTRPSFATFRWHLAHVRDKDLSWVLPVGESPSHHSPLVEKLQALDPDTLMTFRLLMDAAKDFGPEDQRASLKALLEATSF